MDKHLNNALSIAVVMIGGLMIMVQIVVAVAGIGPVEQKYMVLLYVIFVSGMCLFVLGLMACLELWWEARNERKVMHIAGNRSSEPLENETDG